MACSQCDNCYRVTGLASSGGCGCNCDECRRCCGIRKCSSLTFTFTVMDAVCLAQGGCGASTPLHLLETKEKQNYYNYFFDYVKNYSSKKSRINPFLKKGFDILKSKKIKNNNKEYFFDSQVKKFNFLENNKTHWFYLKKYKNYFDNYFYNTKTLNLVLWNGKKWVDLKNNRNFIFKNLNHKSKPFFLIFDNNLNVLQSDNEFYLNKKIDFLICELNKKVKNISEIKSSVRKNIKSNSSFFGNYFAYSLGSCPDCNHSPEYCTICYSFNVTLTRLGSGCGFCRNKSGISRLVITSVGGGCTNFGNYSDPFIECSSHSDSGCISNFDTADADSVAPTILLSDCGLSCGLYVRMTGISSCALCFAYMPFRQNESKLAIKRKQAKELFEKSRKNRKLR